MRRLSPLFLFVLFVGVAGIAADERVDHDVFWKIRQEGTNNSRILQTLYMFTDVYGPRLTGSPNLKAAGEWAVEQMHAWGLKHGRLEPWDFGRPGWTNEHLSAHIVEPGGRAACGTNELRDADAAPGGAAARGAAVLRSAGA